MPVGYHQKIGSQFHIVPGDLIKSMLGDLNGRRFAFDHYMRELFSIDDQIGALGHFIERDRHF